MRLTTLVELLSSNKLSSNLLEHVGSKFVIPFLESEQHCALSACFWLEEFKVKNSIRGSRYSSKFSQFDTIQSIYFRNI